MTTKYINTFTGWLMFLPWKQGLLFPWVGSINPCVTHSAAGRDGTNQISGRARPILTQAKANTRLTLQTMAALSDHGPVASSILGDRVDYVSALIDGRAVLETARSGIAAQEVMDLWAGKGST